MANQNKVDCLQTSTETIIKVNKICRFCLLETKSNITIHDKCPAEELEEFERDSIYNFAKKLNFIKMEDNKDFPSQVCEHCYSLIKICNEFSQLCQKSDNFLRNHYESNLKEIKNPIQDNQTGIKIIIQMPHIQKPAVDLHYSTEGINKNSTSILNEIQKVNEPGLNILEAYKKKLNVLLGKIKEPQLKFTKENAGLVVKKNKHACQQCSLKFNNVQALNFHNDAVHEQKRFQTLFKFQCKNCLKAFNNQAKLERHYKVTHKFSQNEFPQEYLINTMKDLMKVEKFVCSYCDPNKEFTCQDELVEHLESHKLDISQLYSCPFCKNLSFPNKISLNDHLLLMHEANKVIENRTIEEDVKQSDALICMKPVTDSVNNCQNLTDLSAFVHILDSVVDSLTTAQQEKESCFKLICKNCNPPLEFTSTGDFVNHTNTYHHGLKLLENWVIESKAKKDGSWSCSECSASYTRKQSLFCHMRERHKQTILDGMRCLEPGCSESFNTNRQLIQHGIVVHKKYFAYFHKVFKKVLQSTDEEDHRVKNFECDICQKKYIYKTSLRKHIFSSHLEKTVKDPVVCSYCGKTLSSKLNLKSHIEFVHEALFVSCPICKKKINFRTIGKHYKTHKTNSEMVYSKNSFLCNLCGKILKSKRSFEDHQKLHKNIRDELCDICGSGFTTKKFLRLHKKTHEGIPRKIFGCDQCDKVFSGRQTLNRHLLTHSGKKNFVCEICSKCFYTLQELNRHVRYHKKEYRFDCQLCDMKFLDKSRFRHHMMRHRNIRPHKCQFCEKMFIVRGKMNSHMAAKHNVEVKSIKGVWKDPKTYVPLDDLL